MLYMLYVVQLRIVIAMHITTQPKVRDLKQPVMVPHEPTGQSGSLAVLGWGGCSRISSQLVDQLGAG